HTNKEGITKGRCSRAHARQVLGLYCPDRSQPRRLRLEVEKTNSKRPDPIGVTMKDEGNDYDFNPPSTEPGAAASGTDSKVRTAMDWLRPRLHKAPQLIRETISAAERASIKKATLYRAVEELGAISETTWAGKVWKLPKDPAEEVPE